MHMRVRIDKRGINKKQEQIAIRITRAHLWSARAGERKFTMPPGKSGCRVEALLWPDIADAKGTYELNAYDPSRVGRSKGHRSAGRTKVRKGAPNGSSHTVTQVNFGRKLAPRQVLCALAPV